MFEIRFQTFQNCHYNSNIPSLLFRENDKLEIPNFDNKSLNAKLQNFEHGLIASMFYLSLMKICR